MTAQLKYLSDAALVQLRSAVNSNSARYRKDGFVDLADEPGWDIKLGVEYDDSLLASLDLSMPREVAAIDLANSKIVGRALSRLTPALANEERVWVRLAHVEAFDYARTRWLAREADVDLPAAVHKHLFAATQTGIRDDQALSRLWWNYAVAKACLPSDVDSALALILKTADIRSNFVERIWMTSRKRIASAVLRAMLSEPWITSTEQTFREFMKTINRLGGGIVFEALGDSEADRFVAECVRYARL